MSRADGSASGGALPGSDGEDEHKLTFNWKAITSSMIGRRAYRRYHGTHRSTYRFENWGTVLLILLLWGFFQLTIGDIRSLIPPALTEEGERIHRTALERAGNESGLVVTFVWAYVDDAEFWGTVAGGAIYIVVAYILIQYQRALHLQSAAWITIITCAIMLGLAITAGLRDAYSDKLLRTRSIVVWVWISLQGFMIALGLFQKRMLPWLIQSGHVATLELKESKLIQGVEPATEDLWKKLPDLRARLLQEYSNTPIYSFTAEYCHFWDHFLEPFSLTERQKVTYIGGLDDEGAPHGLGVWHDSFSQGELLIGHFMHGMPVAPFRARTNNGSGFAAFRIALFSCRTDAVTSEGSLQGAVGPTRVTGGPRQTPLQFGVTSIECNTSGLFFKGFPRAVWLQHPTPVQETLSLHTSPAASAIFPNGATQTPSNPPSPAQSRVYAPPPAPRRTAHHSDAAAAQTSEIAVPIPEGTTLSSDRAKLQAQQSAQQERLQTDVPRSWTHSPVSTAAAGPVAVSAAAPSSHSSRPAAEHAANKSSAASQQPGNGDSSGSASGSGRALRDQDTHSAPHQRGTGSNVHTSTAASAVPGSVYDMNKLPSLVHATSAPASLYETRGSSRSHPSPGAKLLEGPRSFSPSGADQRPHPGPQGGAPLPPPPDWVLAMSHRQESEGSMFAEVNRRGCLPLAGDRGAPAGNKRPLKKWGSNKALWEPKVDKNPASIARPSHWLEPSTAGLLVGDVSGAESGVPGGAPKTAAASRRSEGGYEVLLFVQGFNCSVESAMSLVAQLLALGSFPSHIMPVVFAWPCTTILYYLMNHKILLSDYITQKFEETLEHLHADGCRRLHIIGHSMGARVLATASDALGRLFPQSADPRAERRPSTAAPKYGPGIMDLASITFLSPDMDYGDFSAHSGPILRAICPLITLYGDVNDDALFWSAFLNTKFFKLKPARAAPGLKEECERLGIPIGTSLGTHCSTVTKKDGCVLDVDFIVTTFLDSNVHAIRHNYFHLNREMVDDLRDLVVTGKRAAHRTYRLEWSGQLTYGFILAPSYVVAN